MSEVANPWAKPAQSPTPSNASDAGESKPVTIRMPEALREKIYEAVYWTPGLTITDLIQEAVGKEIARLEKRRGATFEPRPVEARSKGKGRRR